jgi:GNAT superfamily N-acetyltransferase
MSDWLIERLDASHERGSFCCGKDPLDNFLKTLVGQYERKRLGRTFVATSPGDKRVVGFYTSATGSFSLDSLPEKVRKKLPRQPIPTIHLGRMAVDRACQGKGLGKTLLFHFLHTALAVSRDLGVFAADVWAKDDEALPFYLKYGFIQLQDAPLHVYLPMKTVQQMFS